MPLSQLGKLFDLRLQGSDLTDPESNDLLVMKGNQLHEIILYVVLLYAITLAALNYSFGNITDAYITLSTIPLTLISFILLWFGQVVLSKVWNLIQVVAAVSMISLNSSSNTGVLVFFFPILMAILLVFQGRQKYVGYLLSALVLGWLIFLIQTDLKLPGHTDFSESELTRERILNFTSAGIASVLGMVFILGLSNQIQNHLILKSREVNLKNQELTKANMELDNFVYRVSHDLRSPLLSVKGLLNLTIQLPLQSEKATQYLSMADKSIVRLDETIREILEYSRNARLDVKLESFNIKRTVESIFEDLRYAAPASYVFEVFVTGPDEVLTDGYRINTVLRNLIANSVKYYARQRPDPHVRVNIQNKPEHLIIQVVDNGQGIQEAHLPKVFEMFYRANNSTSGTGLGLYICKEIVTKLNGTIRLESAPEKGTIVEIALPHTSNNT